jgi:hypothetical protein
MSFRRGGEALLALLLILSLSLKVPGSISLQADADTARNVADRVTDFLKRHEFRAAEIASARPDDGIVRRRLRQRTDRRYRSPLFGGGTSFASAF